MLTSPMQRVTHLAAIIQVVPCSSRLPGFWLDFMTRRVKCWIACLCGGWYASARQLVMHQPERNPSWCNSSSSKTGKIGNARPVPGTRWVPSFFLSKFVSLSIRHTKLLSVNSSRVPENGTNWASGALARQFHLMSDWAKESRQTAVQKRPVAERQLRHGPAVCARDSRVRSSRRAADGYKKGLQTANRGEDHAKWGNYAIGQSGNSLCRAGAPLWDRTDCGHRKLLHFSVRA